MALEYYAVDAITRRTADLKPGGLLAEKELHDKMVELVERMLELNKQKHGGTGVPPVAGHGQDGRATADLDREIAATDAEIDNLVYGLYGITDEERKLIEGA